MNRVKVWVHPEFKNELKKLAADSNKSMLAFSKDLVKQDDPWEMFKSNGKKKRNSMYLNSP